MLDYNKYKVNIRTLTPVHIGSGEKYSQLDYVFDKNKKKVFIIDFNKIIANSGQEIIDNLTR